MKLLNTKNHYTNNKTVNFLMMNTNRNIMKMSIRWSKHKEQQSCILKKNSEYLNVISN